jgi:hypothetical protein
LLPITAYLPIVGSGILTSAFSKRKGTGVGKNDRHNYWFFFEFVGLLTKWVA